jgi:hypothetical protein
MCSVALLSGHTAFRTVLSLIEHSLQTDSESTENVVKVPLQYSCSAQHLLTSL